MNLAQEIYIPIIQGDDTAEQEQQTSIKLRRAETISDIHDVLLNSSPDATAGVLAESVQTAIEAYNIRHVMWS